MTTQKEIISAIANTTKKVGMGGTDLKSNKHFKFTELECGFYALAIRNTSFYLVDTNEMFDDILSPFDETFVSYEISEDQFTSLTVVSETQNEMDAELEISRVTYEKAENEIAERDHLAMQAELDKDYAEYNDRENAHQQAEYDKILVKQEVEHNKKMDHYYKYGY